ncbi:MAG TPA: hypothetical protein VFN77_08010 [Acetobacteraceae bacterium]|nr:hypothetical protein [Acetobacteraceae bacterium]
MVGRGERAGARAASTTDQGARAGAEPGGAADNRPGTSADGTAREGAGAFSAATTSQTKGKSEEKN